ncbi:MAG: class I SAM-dependent methyltransferase [Elainellaceae cyanobacterium]
MTAQNDTVFERFIAPIFGSLMMDRDALLRYRNSIDWDAESDRFRQTDLEYPAYYQTQNFHGIENGYLSIDAAVTYDPVTQYAVPPNEQWVRQELVNRIRCRPQRILDLGCGTGSTTLLLKRTFPDAEVIGIDLSPYMLVVADQKAYADGIAIQFKHGNAEQTGFPDESFDMVTASLLFHETPPHIACTILQECWRLLRTGGEVLILDGNQSVLRQTNWLTEIFEEPYIKDYATGSVDAWMGGAGFGEVRTDQVWWVHQVSRGVKPIQTREPERVRFSTFETAGNEQWAVG